VPPRGPPRGQVNFRSHNSFLTLGASSPGRRRACVLFGASFRGGYSTAGLPGDTAWLAFPPTGWGWLGVFSQAPGGGGAASGGFLAVAAAGGVVTGGGDVGERSAAAAAGGPTAGGGGFAGPGLGHGGAVGGGLLAAAAAGCQAAGGGRSARPGLGG